MRNMLSQKYQSSVHVDFGPFLGTSFFRFKVDIFLILCTPKLGMLSKMTFLFVGYLCVFLGVKKVCGLLV